jgi:hypothetical protein
LGEAAIAVKPAMTVTMTDDEDEQAPSVLAEMFPSPAEPFQ